MVTLTQRVRKLEKKVAERSQTAHLDGRVVYQPSKEELAEAVVILIECGAVLVTDRERVWPTSEPPSSAYCHPTNLTLGA